RLSVSRADETEAQAGDTWPGWGAEGTGGDQRLAGRARLQRATAHRPLPSILADVFVPDLGVGRDVAGEEVDALPGVQVDHRHAVLAQPVDPALEGDGLPDDDRPDPELTHQAAAIPAGREGGDHDRVAIAALPPGGAEGGGLPVHGRVAVLDAAVVATTEQRPVAG